jgi:hypothetical protein
MKLKKLNLKNFTTFTDIEVVFNDQVTSLVGLNGEGKTTIGLTAIHACLKGIAEKNKDGQLIGERFRFIGPSKKSADIILTIVDEIRGAEIVVSNRITDSGNSIVFDAPDGYVVDNNWLNSLLNTAFLSAKNFTQLSPKEQALALGINTDEIDKQIVEAKSELTIINRDVKNLGTKQHVDPIDSVSISEILKIKNEIDEQNKVIEQYNTQYNGIVEKLEAKKTRRDELIKELAELESDITKGDNWVKVNAIKKTMPTDHLTKQIEDAESINSKASEYKAYKEWQIKLHESSTKADKQNDKVNDLVAKRLLQITSTNFGVDGLDIGSDGGLLMNDRPIREPYFSKGELEIIVAKLYASTNPKLKVRFIDDYELLDENNAAKLVDDLLSQGFQIIIAQVGNEKKGENSLLIRELKETKK